MSHRKLILEALENYRTNSKSEQKQVKETIRFIEDNSNCFDRTNLEGHVNGSAWIVNKDGTKVLLNHHKKLNRWLQFGGHSDGDNNTWNVALREAKEESGIKNIKFVTEDILYIGINDIPKNNTKGEPAHKHYDISFLLQALDDDFIISEESNSLKWVSSRDLNHMYDNGEIDDAMQVMHKRGFDLIKL